MSTSRDSRLSIQPRSPKALLENSACSEIDGALKTLKVLNRSVLATLGLWQDEARVLERLYYKGKNQHRSAIFWQKTAEMRRFAMRIQGADTPGVIEGIRLSFFSVSAAPEYVELGLSSLDILTSDQCEAVEGLVDSLPGSFITINNSQATFRYFSPHTEGLEQ